MHQECQRIEAAAAVLCKNGNPDSDEVDEEGDDDQDEGDDLLRADRDILGRLDRVEGGQVENAALDCLFAAKAKPDQQQRCLRWPHPSLR